MGQLVVDAAAARERPVVEVASQAIAALLGLALALVALSLTPPRALAGVSPRLAQHRYDLALVGAVVAGAIGVGFLVTAMGP